MQSLFGWILRNDKSWPFFFNSETYVAVFVTGCSGLVVLRQQALNQTHFKHFSGERIRSCDVVDAMNLPQHRPNLATSFRSTEITANSLA